ncbi:MAG: hypothetical protein ACSHYB_03620 [Roseibacillus sp.]
MLNCPYCQAPVLENSPSCPQCALSIEGATSLLGPVPLLNRGLTDTTEALSEKQRRTINSAIVRFERAFPESHLNIVLREFDPKFNLSTHLFWLFNTAGLSPQSSQNEANQDILLGLDPIHGRLGLMVGYGLEPFVTKETIAPLLEVSRPSLDEGKPAEATLQIVKKLSVLLRNASKHAHETLGLRS